MTFSKLASVSKAAGVNLYKIDPAVASTESAIMGHKFINAVTRDSARPKLVGGINLFEDGTPACPYQMPVEYGIGWSGLRSTRAIVDPLTREFVITPHTKQEDGVDVHHPNSLRKQQERRGRNKKEKIAKPWDRSLGLSKDTKKLLWSPTSRF
jgi:hypothetical protein